MWGPQANLSPHFVTLLQGDNVGGVMGDYRRCVNSSDPGLPTGDAANGCPVAADYRALHPVPVFPDFQFSLLSAGEQGTIAAQVCGIAAGTRQGQLYCWGCAGMGGRCYAGSRYIDAGTFELLQHAALPTLFALHHLNGCADQTATASWLQGLRQRTSITWSPSLPRASHQPIGSHQCRWLRNMCAQ